MANDHAKKKALEALEATGNNRREASLLLRVWAETDEKLKTQLVGPFLNNICALAIQSAASGLSTRRKPGRRKRPVDNSASLLEAISGGGAQTMSSTRSSAPPPPASSARHRQAVTLLASAYKPGGKS
ncbi:hypothetical protein [Nisaea sp.]|uniref:hypothetical protein n=1 Tax=Nisaea sp. TaxID=2024842 RepID=UPI003B5197FC